MKALVAPGVVQISSTPGRRRGNPTIPPRPPCFLNLWRDCTNTDMYLQFSNGAIYHYDSPSDEVAVALTTAVTHGRTFNLGYRRSFSVPGGYEIFTGSIPSTATLIYSYPPYAGVDPGPCAMFNFNDTVWDSPPDSDNTTGTGTNSFSNVGNTVSLHSECPLVDNSNATFINFGTLNDAVTTTVNCQLLFDLIAYQIGDPTLTTGGQIVVVDNAGNFYLNFQFDQTTPFGSQVIPFTIPPSAVLPIFPGYLTTRCNSLTFPAELFFTFSLTPAM